MPESRNDAKETPEEENQATPAIRGDAIETLKGEGNQTTPASRNDAKETPEEENQVTPAIRGDAIETLKEEGNQTTP